MAAEQLKIVWALSGETITHLEGMVSISRIFAAVDAALDHAYVLKLTLGEIDILRMAESEIRGPLQCCVLCRKGRYDYGLHTVIRCVGQMAGSENVEHLFPYVDDDLDGLHLMTLGAFYERLFALTRETEGYIVQARLLKAFEIFTSNTDAEPQSLEEVMSVLIAVSSESAMDMLISLHNQRKIEVSTRRFRHLAQCRGIQLRAAPW